MLSRQNITALPLRVSAKHELLVATDFDRAMCICGCELASIDRCTSPTEGIAARQLDVEVRHNLVRHVYYR